VGRNKEGSTVGPSVTTTTTGAVVIVRGEQALTTTEEIVLRALRKHLRSGDVLICGLRIHDHDAGDVEIDFVILMPDAGVAVIEVKGGTVTYANGSWFQTGKDGTQEIFPTRQALKGWHAFRRYVERQPAWSRGVLRGDWFLAFPQTPVASHDMGPEGRRETIFAQGEEAEAVSRIWDILTRPQSLPIPADGWVEQIVELIQGKNDEPLSVEQRVTRRLQDLHEMTKTQASLVTSWRRNSRLDVAGGAGTGKTWLAMEQARMWATEGKKTAFLTYTKGVAEMVKRVIGEVPERERPAYVGTLHALGYQWGVKPTPVGLTDQRYWDQELPETYAAVAKSLPESERFDAFVVDEAQDFADSWWEVIWAAAKDHEQMHLAVFYDDSQAVFHERHGRPSAQMAAFDLDTNYRNSRQVVETFAPLCDRKMNVEGGDGLPTRLVFADPESVLEAADDAVMQLTHEEGWLPEHVALLTTKSRHPVHAERQDADRDAYWEGLWATDDVFYCTVSGFKGLERPAVVVAVDGFHHGIEAKDVLYTALSRATECVVVVGARNELETILGAKHLRRLERRQGVHHDSTSSNVGAL